MVASFLYNAIEWEPYIEPISGSFLVILVAITYLNGDHNLDGQA